MNHDYTPKEIADATVQASYQHPELRGLDIPPVKAILDALPEPVIMPRIDFARNSYVYQYEPKIMPKKSAIDYLIEAFKAPFNQKPKRNPYMTIRRLSSYGGTIGVHRGWCVHCTKCEIPGTKKTLIFAKTRTWQEAITAATRHAHNHH